MRANQTARAQPLRWRGRSLASLPLLAIFAIGLSFSITLLSWHTASTEAYQEGHDQFDGLARDSEQALLSRLNSYQVALLGAAGFVSGSQNVSRDEWRAYVENVNPRVNFPGVLGFGLVEVVPAAEADAFERRVQADLAPSFKIHPRTKPANYVILYIEPSPANSPAIGLNIAFEQNRRDAANWARDTGLAAITRRIALVQDTGNTPGFLLLQPIYWRGRGTRTVAQRRAAFRAWTYTPFKAADFMMGLTKSQGKSFEMAVYEGDNESPENLIYASDANFSSQSAGAKFVVHKRLDVMQQKWTVIWRSTPAYEHTEDNSTPRYILLTGLAFTGLLTVFFVLTAARQSEVLHYWTVEDKYLAVPLVIFLAGAVGSFYLYNQLRVRELENVSDFINADARKINRLIGIQTRERTLALQRMAQRWDNARRTPEKNWRSDARNCLLQMDGLAALEWVDENLQVRWTEPQGGAADAEGQSLRHDSFSAVLAHASRRGSLSMTSPIRQSSREWTTRMAVPLILDNGKPDGYLVGIFSVQRMLDSLLNQEVGQDYVVFISDSGRQFYSSSRTSQQLDTRWNTRSSLQVGDRTWNFEVVPTQHFIRSKFTFLPAAVLVTGILLGFLCAVAFRATLVSRMKTFQIRSREEQLTQSNTLNNAILESANFLIIATDTEGKVVLFNRAAEIALGYSEEEVKGKMTTALWHDPSEVVTRADELSRETGETVTPGFEVFVKKPVLEGAESREWELSRKNGSSFPVNLTVTPLRDQAQNITGFLEVIEDISERKSQRQSLIASEETFRTAMEYAAIGMALVDVEGKFMNVNQALCNFLGYSREELLQTDFQTLTCPEDLEQDISYVSQMLTGELTNYQMEKRYYHRNGKLVWALLSVSLARDAQGAPAYFISQIQDISHAKEVERMKNEFVSIVSHELRTPLTSIRGSLGLIAGVMSEEMPERANNLVNIALKNVERLVLLINDILDMDKIASGKMQFHLAPEHLSALIHQAAEGNQAFAEKYDVSISVEPLEEDVLIDVDSGRFIQVLTNLLSNAAKFSPPSGAVHIYARRDGNRVRISVADQGPGIPEEFRKHIFSKFSQADASVTRTKGGSGLGLHITKQITEQMGGTIGFVSEEGQGSTFWIDFPIVIEHPDLPRAGHEHPVLVFDAGEEVFDQLRGTLDRAGIAVEIAHSISDTLTKLEEQEYAALLLNIMPAVGDSLSLVRQVRTNESTASVPILIFSVTPDETRLAFNGDAVTVADWLHKPVDDQQLIHALRLAVQGSGSVPRILHVEDDPDLSRVLASCLGNEAEIVSATTLARAEQLLQLNHFALIILDIAMPDGSGLSLLEKLKDFHAESTPVLILSASETPAEVQQQVAAAMVKSRMSKTQIVASILKIVNERTHQENPAESAVQ